MSNVEILRQTRAILANEASWTRQEYARNAGGIPVAPDDEEAVCFCMAGAVMRVQASSSFPNLPEIMGLLEEQIVPLQFEGKENNNVSEFNDNRATTHADVLHVLDLAIEAAARTGA